MGRMFLGGFSRTALFAGIIVLGSIASQARAAVVLGQSQGYGVSANLNLTLLSDASVGAGVLPVAPAQGTAPPPYSDTASLASLDVTQGVFALRTGTLLGISTGLLESTATSDVDGLPGPRLTAATNTVNDFEASVLSTLISSLFAIDATTLAASSSVQGDFGSLVATGSTTVEDLTLTLLGTSFHFDGSIAPNTQVGLAGLLGGVTVLLNEQILSGDGIATRGIVTNAVHVRFDDVGVSGIGTLDGDLIIGHTEAEMTAVASAAVPEPSSLAMCGVASLAGLGAWARRRRPAG